MPLPQSTVLHAVVGGSMDAFVARQAIFDAHNEVVGYELLFRDGPVSVAVPRDGQQMTLAVLDNGFFVQGLDALAGAKPAFVNFTREALLADLALALPPDGLVVEVLEDIEPDDQVLDACRRLKQAGYKVALDDYTPTSYRGPLLDLADIIKLDVLHMAPSDVARATSQLRKPGRIVLAEKVENDEMRRSCADAGCELFQGYFHAKPVTLQAAEIPPAQMNRLRLISELSTEEVNFDHIERVIASDIGLTSRLLTLVNSAAYGLRQPVSSVRQAATTLGLVGLRKWTSIIVMRDLAIDCPPEVVVDSLVRGALCEMIAERSPIRSRRHEMFLLGLFSMADVVLKRPLEDVASLLPIADDVRAALLGDEGPMSSTLDLVRGYQQADWPSISNLAGRASIDEQALPELYRDSLAWSQQVSS